MNSSLFIIYALIIGYKFSGLGQMKATHKPTLYIHIFLFSTELLIDKTPYLVDFIFIYPGICLVLRY